ncbi:hypothetical protein AXF42_Ash017363 [Apostasia shenzhenica]|uniref:Uncharacterized protein n=1 Tax=Apostasia shenzhenica TaxID=1088818 RepID=A0A2I0BDG2_9ASPA|nr:hypothetical protein AXF42_Ash017363 [Apostasia shenzhenica]
MVVRTKGDERRLTVVSLPSANQGDIYRGEVGLALGSGLMSRGLEEKLERTSTPELYLVLARLSLALNRALRTEEQVLEQGRQLHQRDEEIEALRVQFAVKSSQLDAVQKEKAKLQQEFAIYKSAMSALKADNKALREKMYKVAGDQETVAAEKSAAAVKAYKTSLSCRKKRLDGIK